MPFFFIKENKLQSYLKEKIFKPIMQMYDPTLSLWVWWVSSLVYSCIHFNALCLLVSPVSCFTLLISCFFLVLLWVLHLLGVAMIPASYALFPSYLHFLNQPPVHKQPCFICLIVCCFTFPPLSHLSFPLCFGHPNSDLINFFFIYFACLFWIKLLYFWISCLFTLQFCISS